MKWRFPWSKNPLTIKETVQQDVGETTVTFTLKDGSQWLNVVRGFIRKGPFGNLQYIPSEEVVKGSLMRTDFVEAYPNLEEIGLAYQCIRVSEIVSIEMETKPLIKTFEYEREVYS